MTYVPSHIRGFAIVHDTSVEIARAIFEIADDGDEERMWRAPSAEESEAVLKRAWEFAGPADAELRWSDDVYRRP
ncbi:YccJ family protein [Methylocella sp.]|uniref:YccJ family protein n=1 Tax=Methylocella sp. TaxID=1978226 RepID=UPI003784841E